jgi:hypothetical protein
MTTFGSHVCGDLKTAKKSQMFTDARFFDEDIWWYIMRKLYLEIER